MKWTMNSPKNHWRQWFAWRPVQLDYDINGVDIWSKRVYVWLEYVDRRKGEGPFHYYKEALNEQTS